MLARHMCSGRPVLADCWCTKSSGDLRAVAQRQRRRRSNRSAGLLDHLDQVVDRNVPQDLAGSASLPHVALHHAAVGLADLGNRLAGAEVR